MWMRLGSWMDPHFFPLVSRWLRYQPGSYRGLAEPCGQGLAAAAGAGPPADLTLSPAPAPRWLGRRATPGGCRDLRFTGPLQGDGSPALARLLLADPAGPWCLVLPGYLTGLGGGGWGVFQRAHARTAVAAGFNVALLAPPFHLDRAPAGRWSGELLFTADLGRTAAALEGWVAEAVALAAWLRQEYGTAVGAWGISLGGLCAGLGAAARDDWAFVALHAPLGDIPAALWASRAAAGLRGELAAHGVDRAALAAALAPLNPAGLAPRAPRKRTCFLIPTRDRIVPTATQEAWWEAWGRPARVDLPTGHLLGTVAGRALAAAMAFARTRVGAGPRLPAGER